MKRDDRDERARERDDDPPHIPTDHREPAAEDPLIPELEPIQTPQEEARLAVVRTILRRHPLLSLLPEVRLLLVVLQDYAVVTARAQTIQTRDKLTIGGLLMERAWLGRQIAATLRTLKLIGR